MLQMCAELGFQAQDMGSDLKRVVLDLKTSAASDHQPSGAVSKR
jgi:hypothetical protein